MHAGTGVLVDGRVGMTLALVDCHGMPGALDIALNLIEEFLMLPYVVGIVLSIGVAVFARRVGFDRDRAFYPAALIVIASYYVLCAAMAGSIQTVVLESALMTLFVIAAVAGFKGSAWIVVGTLAGHGIQDAVHGHIVANAGVPAWWPAWCLAYDVGAAGALAWLLMRADLPSTAAAISGSRRASAPDVVGVTE
jgi:hypothetical protein